MTAKPARIIKIFYCYAPADHVLRDELEKHLSPLRRLRQVTWSDCNILAGTNWEQEIERRIDTAHLILLLISPDFIASDQCYTVEMQQALERQQTREAQVVPIILRPVYWEEVPFNQTLVLPTNGKPVTQWRNRDEALLNVTRGVCRVVRRLLTEQALSEQETSILERMGQLTKPIIGVTLALPSLPEQPSRLILRSPAPMLAPGAEQTEEIQVLRMLGRPRQKARLSTLSTRTRVTISVYILLILLGFLLYFLFYSFAKLLSVFMILLGVLLASALLLLGFLLCLLFYLGQNARR